MYTAISSFVLSVYHILSYLSICLPTCLAICIHQHSCQSSSKGCACHKTQRAALQNAAPATKPTPWQLNARMTLQTEQLLQSLCRMCLLPPVPAALLTSLLLRRSVPLSSGIIPLKAGLLPFSNKPELLGKRCACRECCHQMSGGASKISAGLRRQNHLD